MDVKTIIEWMLHIDRHLNELVVSVGPFWFYAVLVVIIFCETGLVVTPFLPGDSLLFAVGALCATDNSPLTLAIMIPVLILAAIAGDAVNYWIGAQIGPKVFHSDTSRWLNKEHLVRAQYFYETYGAKTIILARFIPIVRTFAPFVAGIGQMHFGRFWFYNILGGSIWVTVFLLAGYQFAQFPWIKENFLFVSLGIIAVSFLPVVYEWHKAKKDRQQSSVAADSLKSNG